MRRVMSLWLPHWPIERWRRQHPGPPSAKPFVLVNRVGARSLLSAVDAAAAAEGLTPGLALADARALRPDLAWGPADPAADAKALARLAVWCGRFSPWTAPHGEEGIWLDVTGVAHLHGGEESLAREVVERLGRQGITARAVIAETAGAAWALARGSGTAVRVLARGRRARRLPRCSGRWWGNASIRRWGFSPNRFRRFPQRRGAGCGGALPNRSRPPRISQARWRCCSSLSAGT